MVDFTEQRKNMIDNHLMPCGVRDPILLNIAKQINRENFLPDTLKSVAYKDGSILFGDGKFMLRPNDLLRMTLAMGLHRNEAVLDIGCTTGYSSILMSFLTQKVTGLDDSESYISHAKKLAAMEGVSNIEFVAEKTEVFLEKGSSYPAILIQYAYRDLPPYFYNALDEGGRLVYIRQNSSTYGQAVRAEKYGGRINQTPLFELCAPYLNNNSPQGFQF